ncbi:RHE_PE00001 family protein [Bradyrhizobium sp. Gha]|uniref:RHE_PE00001 family protein n=1 Tax=Bradyrhizobium sp. Gha TaxID=1855318 RepID=UPI0008F35576|nr:RHE_PE00001 family protein [Bradyrhizobium sp. Gha]SFJ59783.1 HTH DNA binding domain-containing protein [Bradyrhizobium sp. Gha]
MTETKAVLASVSLVPLKVIRTLLPTYQIPDPLPWAHLVGPLAAAEDAVARLDERLAKSPIRDGAISRTHFTDACASLWLDGELVHLEDLVLHDAGMDVRAPTHELTRAHAVLRARRRIAEAKPDWALSATGLASLRGRGEREEERSNWNAGEGSLEFDEDAERDDMNLEEPLGANEADSHLASAFAAVDAANARTERRLADETRFRPERDSLIYDPDWDEEGRLDRWRDVVNMTRGLPPTLAGAIATEAWGEIEPLEHTPWLGRLLGAALLRDRGKTRWHLPCLYVGLKSIPRERRRPRDAAARLVVQLDAMTAAAESGRKDHDRWLMTRNLLARKLAGRRATSKLPALLDYVLTRPIVSAGMIAAELGITPRAAQNLVAELGLREATGRGRYRAWGVL